jgi:hypothetical protein
MTITLKAWTSGRGERRRYVNGWETLIGLEVERYNTGNISSAWLQDGPSRTYISNAEASRLLVGKIWVDDEGGVHVNNWSARKVDVETVRKAVKAALAAGDFEETA